MYIELTTKGKIVVIAFAVLGVIALYGFASSGDIKVPEGFNPGAQTGYYTIGGQYGDHLLNTVPNLVVVDCNSDNTNYLDGKLVTKAVWSTDSSMFINNNKPMLVYSTPDDAAVAYCKSLMGKVYGEVYMMQGGYEGWYAWVHRNDGG
jgi:hypothetical protein